MMSLPDPWFEPDETAKQHFDAEASREIKAGHDLHGLRLSCIGKCDHCDDVVFDCGDGTFAIIHLTWSEAERPPWPRAVRIDSMAALEQAMNGHGD